MRNCSHLCFSVVQVENRRVGTKTMSNNRFRKNQSSSPIRKLPPSSKPIIRKVQKNRPAATVSRTISSVTRPQKTYTDNSWCMEVNNLEVVQSPKNRYTRWKGADGRRWRRERETAPNREEIIRGREKRNRCYWLDQTTVAGGETDVEELAFLHFVSKRRRHRNH